MKKTLVNIKFGFPRIARALITVIGIAALAGGGDAYAAYMVQTAAVAIPGGFDYEGVASYNIGPYWNPAPVGSYFYSNPDPGRYYDSTVSGTVDATGKATASFDTATAVSNANYQNWYGVPPGSRVSSAYAGADLSTGSLKASASGNVDQEGVGYAAFKDVIHYTVAGADAGTVTDVNLHFTLNGLVSGSGSALIDWNMWFGGADLYYEAADNGATGNVLEYTAGYYPGAAGWVSYDFVSQDPTNFIFDGVYVLHGASGDIAISGALNVIAGVGMTADFSHTALYGLIVPGNVTYTSDSGVFLTANGMPVPEPSTILLLGAGLAGLGLWGRKRMGRSQHLLFLALRVPARGTRNRKALGDREISPRVFLVWCGGPSSRNQDIINLFPSPSGGRIGWGWVSSLTGGLLFRLPQPVNQIRSVPGRNAAIMAPASHRGTRRRGLSDLPCGGRTAP